MSDLHKKHGHFSLTIQRFVRCEYRSCPICGGQCATDYNGHTDHIVSLYLFDRAPNVALALLNTIADGIHGQGNAWRLCGRCHARKTNAENRAAGDWKALEVIAKKYLRKCYTFHKSGEISRKKCKMKQVKKVPQREKRLRLRRERAERVAAARKA